jgi:FkbM family methyltransferase
MIMNRGFSNIDLRRVALGGEGEVVEIGIPLINKQKKFGYARIRQMSEYLEYAETETVPNVKGDEIFAKLDRLDFIKCDVEGAEVPVFESMPAVIAKHLPVLLLELADKNERAKMMEMLESANYAMYLLKEKKLKRIDQRSDEIAISHNHYFIPASKLHLFRELING